MRTKSPNCWVLSCCFLYVFRPEVVWFPVLQLSKAEDAYAPRGASFGSRFQSPSLSPSGVREANRSDRQYKFPIFNTSVDTLLYKCKHSYTAAVNVLYKRTDIYVYHRKWDMKPYNKMSKRKQYKGCRRKPLK